jgi:hypothetical protein
MLQTEDMLTREDIPCLVVCVLWSVNRLTFSGSSAAPQRVGSCSTVGFALFFSFSSFSTCKGNLVHILDQNAEQQVLASEP